MCVSFPLLMQNKNYQAYSDDSKGKVTVPQKLHLYHWFRIILDEGHEIIDGIDKSSGYRQKLSMHCNYFLSFYFLLFS